MLPEAVVMWQARLAEQPGDHPRRMLAWMNLQRAKARWGEGDLAVGAALAERPVVTLQALATAL